MEPRTLRIGVDISPLTKLYGGVAYYIEHLLDELIQQKSDYQFFLYAASSEMVEHFGRYKNVSLRIAPYFSQKGVIWRNVNLPFLLRRDKIDVFWQTMMVWQFLLPKKIKTLLTIYDFVAFLFPETMAPYCATYYKLIMKGGLKRADYVLPISQGTGMRLKEMFGTEYRAVVYPPIKPEVFYRRREQVEPFLAEKGLEYDGYLLTVSTWEPRKNFALLVRLYCETLEKHGTQSMMPLVIIGGGGWKNQEIQDQFSRACAKYPSHFKVIGYVADRDLSFYLSGAHYYVALSKYEGYGMPIAEARRCRTPVICMDVPEMREAAENDGIFLAEDRVEIELPALMLKGAAARGEKAALNLNYSTTAENAAKMGAVIEEIQEALI